MPPPELCFWNRRIQELPGFRLLWIGSNEVKPKAFQSCRIFLGLSFHTGEFGQFLALCLGQIENVCSAKAG
jgi:hypothetical protein